MPRASWRGFLRLSLVSCPIYLSPATTRAKSIRLHQVWQRKAGRQDSNQDDDEGEPAARPDARSFIEDSRDDTATETMTATRVSLLPHDPRSGEEIEREQIVKGYEYERGRFVTLTADELKALDVESSKIIDLESFVPRGEVDPVYFSTPYYVYPDGAIAEETFRVIGAGMAEAGTVGIGRMTLSRRERLVMVEPRDAGMVLITLRASEEVRAAAFGKADTESDADMVAVAGTIIKRRSGHFDPATFRDRYQEVLRELIEAKMKCLPVKPKQIATPAPVLDLMSALKRSLAQETGAAAKPRRRAAGDRRQTNLLLPVSGKKEKETPTRARTAAGARRRKA